MSFANERDSRHLGESITGECPRCRLPIYESDPRRMTGIPPGTSLRYYHAGCAMAEEGEYWETQVQAMANRLRGCGYTVELKIIRPVR